ncbi:hypothetical protein B2J93_9256 [Marssonina coronariae]|uniref:Uncharacterized protein n=1 Tax=Diplocarpon coronariae TaxID=2795749 RepID=A0A218ZFZ7_9HELO|nr:hypothetical protein JHW43_007931 [Diplocarpon mali]OWP06483.1 hypothetical protein B2J93_9256 [Marssonina coronariae]
MPRKLPWLSSSSTTVTRSQASTPDRKRKKADEFCSDFAEGGHIASIRKCAQTQGRLTSSSPPPEPPPESFMYEGKDKDDRYRMVEDEFLAVAQQFTVHLHTADYKRQQKAVKSQNADTINSISRPVTCKMTDHTKRKAEAAALTKRQISTESLNGNISGALPDESDEEGLPYIGTTLHGLMDSPRKRAASLAKFGTKATTRAAAGFLRSAVQSKSSHQITLVGSPQPKHAPAEKQIQNDGSSETDDGDDDLDAPIAAPKLVGLNRESTVPHLLSRSMPSQPTSVKKEPQPFSSLGQASRSKSVIKDEPLLDSSAATTFFTSAPPSSRLQRIREARSRKEDSESVKKEYDFDAIPSFEALPP